MHSLFLVTGKNINKQLMPFSCHYKIDPYKVFLDKNELNSMGEHFKIEFSDISHLAAKMQEWNGAEGHIEEGKIFYLSTENINGKLEWFQVGGRFSGYLKIKEERSPGFFGRLRGKRPTDSVNSALKSEIVEGYIEKELPAGILHNDQWIESPLTQDEKLISNWKKRFIDVFESVPNHYLITVVDLHQ